MLWRFRWEKVWQHLLVFAGEVVSNFTTHIDTTVQRRLKFLSDKYDKEYTVGFTCKITILQTKKIEQRVAQEKTATVLEHSDLNLVSDDGIGRADRPEVMRALMQGSHSGDVVLSTPLSPMEFASVSRQDVFDFLFGDNPRLTIKGSKGSL